MNQPTVFPEAHVTPWHDATGLLREGLTKREHFAALALQGLLANPSWSGSSMAVFASDSVQAADALIEALNAPKKP